ncbi:hypothetical protein NDU88_004957 [Pleurodeles waltl]|uniref:Uncharacterized protein n=1 Tax=Pleurodeles waltl TaxID=8319 RepID=A0AAV7KZE7_PLEWA|nr:hypothetical protein NDU88_004957 [Pleurodeles waltl]
MDGQTRALRLSAWQKSVKKARTGDSPRTAINYEFNDSIVIVRSRGRPGRGSRQLRCRGEAAPLSLPDLWRDCHRNLQETRSGALSRPPRRRDTTVASGGGGWQAPGAAAPEAEGRATGKALRVCGGEGVSCRQILQSLGWRGESAGRDMHKQPVAAGMLAPGRGPLRCPAGDGGSFSSLVGGGGNVFISYSPEVGWSPSSFPVQSIFIC